MWFFVRVCSSWQDFNWLKGSRGPSAAAELLVVFEETIAIFNDYYFRFIERTDYGATMLWIINNMMPKYIDMCVHMFVSRLFGRQVRRVPVLWRSHYPVQRWWVLQQSKELTDRPLSDTTSPSDVNDWTWAAVHHWPVWTWRQTDRQWRRTWRNTWRQSVSQWWRTCAGRQRRRRNVVDHARFSEHLQKYRNNRRYNVVFCIATWRLFLIISCVRVHRRSHWRPPTDTGVAW